MIPITASITRTMTSTIMQMIHFSCREGRGERGSLIPRLPYTIPDTTKAEQKPGNETRGRHIITNWMLCENWGGWGAECAHGHAESAVTHSSVFLLVLDCGTDLLPSSVHVHSCILHIVLNTVYHFPLLCVCVYVGRVHNFIHLLVTKATATCSSSSTARSWNSS